MPNSFFKFKQFTVHQQAAAMKVTTDGCLFGAWCAGEINNEQTISNNCLDIGTGTGLLSLMIAQKNYCLIDAVEIDKPACLEAIENINATPWKERIKIICTDINGFDGMNYDCIVCNPPFYENELASPSEEKNTAHHSLHLQLSHLFKIINNKLNSQGSFYLLLPYKRMEEIINLLRQNNLFPAKMFLVKQTPKHSPFRILIKGYKNPSAIENKTIVICKEDRNYTDEFIQLLKDYYLYL